MNVKEFREKDDIKRTADIYIYSSYLESVQSSNGFASLGASSSWGAPFMHWGVIVEYKDGLIYTFDGDSKEGIYYGQFVVWVRKGQPRKIESRQFMGSVRCSPKELISRVRNSADSQSCYNFVLSNCQTWACHFCKEISGDKAESQPITSKDVAIAGVTATVAVGCFTSR